MAKKPKSSTARTRNSSEVESPKSPQGNPFALHSAAGALDLARVRQLLADGADPNALKDGMGPLVAACARSFPDLDVVRALLAAGADPNAGSVTFPLAQAVASGNLELVQVLLAAGANPNRRDRDGGTPLMVAGRRCADAVPLLLAAGANANLEDHAGRTALAHAIADRNDEAIPALRAATESTDSAVRPWRSPQSQAAPADRLVQAADGGDLEFLRTLLDGGLSPDEPNAYGKRALHFAAEHGQVDMIDELLARGAAVDARGDYQQTPLFGAAGHGQLAALRRLLDAGADPAATAGDGRNGLHANIGSGSSINLDIIDALIAGGADVNARDNFGFTPLHWVAEHGKRNPASLGPAVVERLVQAGANLAIQDSAHGWTPFLRAAAHANTAIVGKFLELGANSADRDPRGESARDLARKWGDPEVVKLLEK